VLKFKNKFGSLRVKGHIRKGKLISAVRQGDKNQAISILCSVRNVKHVICGSRKSRTLVQWKAE
jgi:hypothetical protein